MFKQDLFLEENSKNIHPFVGIHVLAELYGADFKKLDNTDLIKNAIIEGVKQSGANLCEIVIQKFEPIGCTLVAVLSESHVSIHTYPEKGAAFVDAFTCGISCNPEIIINHLYNVLEAKKIEKKEIYRGKYDENLKV